MSKVITIEVEKLGVRMIDIFISFTYDTVVVIDHLRIGHQLSLQKKRHLN
jgi:hypothetical protein